MADLHPRDRAPTMSMSTMWDGVHGVRRCANGVLHIVEMTVCTVCALRRATFRAHRQLISKAAVCKSGSEARLLGD